VGHLVGDGVGQLRVLLGRSLLPKAESVVESNTPWVLHGSKVELGNEDGIVFLEWKSHPEKLLVETLRVERDLEDEILDLQHVLLETLATIDRLRQSISLSLDRPILTSNHTVQIGWQ
jgi:hypothetical protein